MQTYDFDFLYEPKLMVRKFFGAIFYNQIFEVQLKMLCNGKEKQSLRYK